MGESECVGGVRDGRVSGGPREGRGVVSNDAPPRAIVFSSGAKDGERREFFLSRRSSRTGHIFFCTSRDRWRASLARILIPRAAVPRGWGERSPAPRRSPRMKKKHDAPFCGSLADFNAARLIYYSTIFEVREIFSVRVLVQTVFLFQRPHFDVISDSLLVVQIHILDGCI